MGASFIKAMRKPYVPTVLSSPGMIAAGLLIALLSTAALSWAALTGPFLFDDFPNLENLARLNGSTDWASLANYAASYRGEPGRPLSMLSFVINDFDWPSSPWSFKYTNLLLHLLVGVMVFGLARALAGSRTFNRANADLIALVTMAAWLLHPMQLSTSMLVIQRMTQLSALFAFAGLWSYVALAKRASGTPKALAAIAALGTGTILSVLCKETGALVPLLAAVLNATLLRRDLQSMQAGPRRILRWGTLLPVIVLFATLSLQFHRLTGYGSRPFDLGERLLTEARVLWEYLFHILVPSLRGGGIYHDDFVISRNLLSPWTTLPSIIALAGVSVIALLKIREWPVFAFAVFWFLGGHLLESSVFPLELYFEHRNYLPMLGPIFAIVLWIGHLANNRRRWGISAAVAWIAFAAMLTGIQAPIWGNKTALVTVWAIEHPDSARAVQQQAAEYYWLGEHQHAAATLINAYERGVRGADFPLQVLLLACLKNDPALSDRVEGMVAQSIGDAEYNRALLATISKLRVQVQGKRCPDLVNETRWLRLTSNLLANPNYARGSSAAYVHVERASFYTYRRDLNSTMLELESAWENNSSPDLAQLVSATLASAGLYEQAEVWARRALEHRTDGIRGWFSQDDKKSRLMLDALISTRHRQEHASETGAKSEQQ